MQRFTQPQRARKRPLSEINVVPYIDVMLVLLVIFMITAPLLQQGVNVQLPQAAAKSLDAKQPMPIIVSVDQFGRYYLNVDAKPEQPISAQTLMAKTAALIEIAKRHHQKRPVYVKGDRHVNYGKVVQAMVLLQHAGVADVGLMTRSRGS